MNWRTDGDPESVVDNDRDEANIERWRNPEMSRREIAEERGYDRADDSLTTEHEPCRKPGCLPCDVLPKALAEHRAEMDANYWGDAS